MTNRRWESAMRPEVASVLRVGVMGAVLAACSPQAGGQGDWGESDAGFKDVGALDVQGSPADSGSARDAATAATDRGTAPMPMPMDGRCTVVELGSVVGMGVAQADTTGRPSQLSTGRCGLPQGGSLGGDMAGEVVYGWTAPQTGSYTFDTLGSSYDTILYVRTRCDGDELACNDDVEAGGMVLQSSVTLSLSAGQRVLLIVDAYGTGAGRHVLNIASRSGGCVPNCGGRQCGSNGCGGVCGNCAAGQACGTDGRCVETRSEAERACPLGGTLRVQLVQTSATPTNPNGEHWDGPSSTAKGALCDLAAVAGREYARRWLNSMFPRAGSLIDDFFGDRFEQWLAEQCRVGVMAVRGEYAGPDMFVVGYLNGTRVWQTPAEQDRWVAPERVSWAQAEWRLPCQSTSTLAFNLIDEDLVADDAMESVGPIQARQVPPRAICEGWGLIYGRSGMVSAVLRLSVEGATPSCAGLTAATFDAITLAR